MSYLLLTSAIKLAQMIRLKEVSSEEVVKTFIQQAKKMNPLVNAIVVDRYDAAIADAKKVDQILKGDPDSVPPLFGVPCTVKATLAYKGMPYSLAIVQNKDNISEVDSTIVARLKAAGAIPLGITNIPILSRGYESVNKLYGKSSNPYNLEYSPGGSSGGEGALVAASGTAFGLGVDGGGSIRIPANYCGVFGHKPSAHLIPESKFEGSKSKFSEYWEDIVVSGPITRYSEDLMPIMRILAGPDGIADVEDLKLKDEDSVDIKSLRFYYCKLEGLNPDIQLAYDNAVKLLKNEGAKFEEMSNKLFDNAYDIQMNALGALATMDEYLEMLHLDKSTDLKKLFEREMKYGDTDLTVNMIAILIKASQQTDEGLARYFKMALEIKEELHSKLRNDGVLILPVHPHVAIKHAGYLENIESTALTGLFNMTQSAATAIPTGFNEDGMPVGIQAVARKGQDHLSIAVAKFMESKGCKWVPPKLAEL